MMVTQVDIYNASRAALKWINRRERASKLVNCSSVIVSRARIKCHTPMARVTPATVPECRFNKYCKHTMSASVVFSHLGKGGGGSINLALRQNNITVKRFHPKPPGKKSWVPFRNRNGSLIVNIRDPVDRFVSAFRWRLTLFCHENDECIPVYSNNKTLFRMKTAEPQNYCIGSDSNNDELNHEKKTLTKTYHSDPSGLAEALCEGRSKTAVKDLYGIHHMYPLAKWLKFLLASNSTDHGVHDIIAIPLEHQLQEKCGKDTFKEYLNQLPMHLLSHEYGRDLGENVLAAKTHKPTNNKQVDASRHSSAQFFNNSGITLLGECCMARFLEKDYQIIQTMVLSEAAEDQLIQPLKDAHPVFFTACSWGSCALQQMCQSDLRSMLARRAMYLNKSLGGCTEIINQL